MKTHSTILNKDFDFKPTHLGIFLNDDLSIQSKWVVIIENESFEYFTCIGHLEVKDIFRKDRFKELQNLNPKKTKENLLHYVEELRKVSKPKPLNIDDVLYCLISDASLSNDSFEDFCFNLGYNEDSINHLNIYNECKKNGKKVKTFIKNIEEAQELFNEY